MMIRRTEPGEEVTATIRGGVRRGEYPAGIRVPSQVRMFEEFRVSSRTIGQVLANLRDGGYLWTLPHKGSPHEHWHDNT